MSLLVSVLQRAGAEDREPRLRQARVDERERAEERRVVLLRDQAADGDRERCLGRYPRRLRGRSGGGGRQLVEAVVNRHELCRIVTGTLEKAAHGVGDRDQPAGRARERAVDVAKRAEQVAVVVVAGRDGRDPQQLRRCAAVDVGVNEVRMDEVGPLDPDGADQVTQHPRADVEPAADRAVGHAEPVELRVEAAEVAPRHVQPEKARVDPALPQRGQQGQQVALGAADPGQLVQVDDLHRSRRS